MITFLNLCKMAKVRVLFNVALTCATLQCWTDPTNIGKCRRPRLTK
jgi:hypothetical protein